MTEAPDPWRSARLSMARLDASGTTGRSLLGFGAISISIMLVVLATLFAGANINRLRDSFAWVEHTNRVMLEAASVHEALLEAGSATRSYLLTRDADYIAIHERAQRGMHERLDELGRLVADNAVQLARVREIRTLIGTREKLLEAGGGLGPQTRDVVIAGMRGAGPAASFRGFTQTVGARFAAFQATELQLLQARQDKAQRAERFTTFLALLTALLALAAGGIGLYVVQRERAEHRAREMELILTHTQRLMLMGETSLALAHELNQPLSAAGNYLSALRRFLAAENGGARARADDTAEKARAQVLRAGEIVRRLRNFVANGDNERSAQDVQVLFEDAVALLGTIDEGVTLNSSLAPRLPPVFVDRVQIQQVLVNLMRNAIEAMRNSPARVLTLTARADGRDCVLISLQDSGGGLPREVATRLFKPFVTTKSNGMGVGLSICQRIVLDHGGRIWAESVDGEGALFCFTLPVARMEEAA
jgi:two-component system sensor kinase FixL